MDAKIARQLRSVWHDGWAVVGAHVYLRSAELGPRVRVWGRPVISNEGTLRIGARVRLVSTIARLELVVERGATLEIGEQTFVNYGCSIAATKLIRIGPRCNIGTHVLIMDNDYHELAPNRRDQRPASAPVIVEENVWIGARAIILRGVTIGRDSVIAAGSVVGHDVEPGCVVGGSPARLLKRL